MIVCCVNSRRHLPRLSPDTYKGAHFAQFWCNLTPFRINTCKSVSKQTTLSPFRINTYEKTEEWGALQIICLVAAPSSIFRTHFQVPYPATPLIATLTKTAGVCTNNSQFGTRTDHRQKKEKAPAAARCLFKRRCLKLSRLRFNRVGGGVPGDGSVAEIGLVGHVAG